MTDLVPYPLSPGFLQWLGHFLGYWSDGESEFQVYRRNDGWIQARRFNGSEPSGSVPVGMVLRDARKLREPESPLGPSPVVLSQALMEMWLTPEQWEALRGAWNVSAGRKRIRETIEQRISELSPQEIWTVETRAWMREAQEKRGIPESEEETALILLEEYREACLEQGAVLADRSYKWGHDNIDTSGGGAPAKALLGEARNAVDRATKSRLQKIVVGDPNTWGQIDPVDLARDLALISPVDLDIFRAGMAIAFVESVFEKKAAGIASLLETVPALFGNPETFEWNMREMYRRLSHRADQSLEKPTRHSRSVLANASSKIAPNGGAANGQLSAERDLVYRTDTDTTAVFAPRWLAERVEQIHVALSSRTWGEFKNLMPADEYERIMCAQFDDDGTARPGIEEAFDAANVWGVGDGDYPPWLAQEMGGWIPSDLLAKYATYETTRLNGDYWEIPVANAEKLADELRARGYAVTKVVDGSFY